MVFRPRMRPAAAVTTQAVLGVVGSQVVGVARDQRALMSDGEDEKGNGEKDDQAENHGHAAVQTALTSLRRGASLPWAAWGPALAPGTFPSRTTSRRWPPP